jgi:serine/threonine protein kinase
MPVEFLTPRSNFTVCVRLGAGAFSVVYRAEDRITSQAMALKVIKKCGTQTGEIDVVRVEVDAMKWVMGDQRYAN